MQYMTQYNHLHIKLRHLREHTTCMLLLLINVTLTYLLIFVLILVI